LNLIEDVCKDSQENIDIIDAYAAGGRIRKVHKLIEHIPENQ